MSSPHRARLVNAFSITPVAKPYITTRFHRPNLFKSHEISCELAFLKWDPSAISLR